MATRYDVNKQNQQIRKTDQGVNSDKKFQRNLQHKKTTPDKGLCIVTKAFAMGPGSMCEVEILGDGIGTGLAVQQAYCRSAYLKPGQRVTYQVVNGKVELQPSPEPGSENVAGILAQHGHSHAYDGGPMFDIVG